MLRRAAKIKPCTCSAEEHELLKDNPDYVRSNLQFIGVQTGRMPLELYNCNNNGTLALRGIGPRMARNNHGG